MAGLKRVKHLTGAAHRLTQLAIYDSAAETALCLCSGCVVLPRTDAVIRLVSCDILALPLHHRNLATETRTHYGIAPLLQPNIIH